jgi:hypothetical protein
VLIRNHPELKDWHPEKGIAYPGPFPSTKLIASLPVEAIIYKPPSKIVFSLRGASKKCLIAKSFNDFAFAEELYLSRHKFIGLPFSLIGGINLRPHRSRLLYWFSQQEERRLTNDFQKPKR